MFDLGWQEFLLVALVAVVVVGPKDLPRVVRTVSQWIRKARSVASEFQGSLEEMAREADLDDVRKQVQSVSRDGLGKSLEKQFDPDAEIRSSFDAARKSADAEGIEKDLNETRAAVQDLSKDDSKPVKPKDGSASGSASGAGAASADPSIGDPETIKALEAAEVGASNKTSKIEPASGSNPDPKHEPAPAAPQKREES